MPIFNNHIKDNTLSFLENIESKRPSPSDPSAKKISAYLSSKKGKNAFQQISCEKKELLKKHLKKKLKDLQTERPGKFRRSIQKIKRALGLKTEVEYCQEALAIVKEEVKTCHRGNVNQFINDTADFFAALFKQLREENIEVAQQNDFIPGLLEAAMDMTVKKNQATEVNIHNKTFFVVKTCEQNAQGGNVTRFTLLAFDTATIAAGMFNEINSLHFNENLVVKSLSKAAQEVKPDELKRETQIQKRLNKGGVKIGVQQKPSYLVKRKGENGGKHIIRCITQKFQGSGEDLITRIGQKLPSECFESGLQAVRTINKGLINILHENVLHTDHKSGNTLYKTSNDGGFEVVISDFGGDVLIDELPSLIKRYRAILKNLDDPERQDKNQQSELAVDILDKIQGDVSLYMFCPEDNEAIKAILRNKDIDDENAANAVAHILEKRIVYSNALVSLSFLSGKALNNILSSLDLFNEDLTIKKYMDLEDFKNSLLRFSQQNGCNLEPLNERMIEALFRSLTTDHTQRPTLQEYADSFED